MAQQFKFEDPSDVVVLNSNHGQIRTSRSEAAIDYSICAPTSYMADYTIELDIDCQDFTADDLDDLISFLQTAKQKLVELQVKNIG